MTSQETPEDEPAHSQLKWGARSEAEVRQQLLLYATKQCSDLETILKKCQNQSKSGGVGAIISAWSCREEKSAFDTCLSKFRTGEAYELLKKVRIQEVTNMMQDYKKNKNSD